MRRAVEWPLQHRETFQRLGLRPPRGILLYGPPGCSKTTMVKALARTAGATFLSLNSATLYSAYVGEAERAGMLCRGVGAWVRGCVGWVGLGRGWVGVGLGVGWSGVGVGGGLGAETLGARFIPLTQLSFPLGRVLS